MDKLLLAVSAVLSAASLMATDYVAVSFSSLGTDRYADDSLVLDDEIYALVWTAGEFSGFNVDGSLKNPNDLVIPVSLKKGEGAVVNLPADSKFVTSGTLAVYLIDTRTFTQDDDTASVTASVTALKDGKIARVNSSAKLDVSIKLTSGSVPVTVAAGLTEKEEPVASALPDDIPMPVITRIDPSGDMVTLIVDKTVPAVNYAVQGGATPAANGQIGPSVTGNGNTIKLFYPKTSDTAFMKVVRGK